VFIVLIAKENMS